MKVLYADTTVMLSGPGLKALVGLLPPELQARALHYRVARAAAAYTAGRLMLKAALLESGLPEEHLRQIRYTSTGKPLLDGLCFNIAHSGNYVVIAFSTEIRMGIDIELPRKINLPDFRPWFRPDEWLEIIRDGSPEDKFYWFWVRKESVLKAAGMAMSELRNIRIHPDGTADTGPGTELWQIAALPEKLPFTGALATNAAPQKILIRNFSFNE